MKKRILKIARLSTCSLALVAGLLTKTLVASDKVNSTEQVAGKPNYVFIFVDDMGWTGTSVQSDKNIKGSRSDFYKTPNLEKLAATGVIFSHAYSPAPMCTPSRASVLTGMSPAQLHVTTPGPVKKASASQKMVAPTHLNYLEEKQITIAELLKKAGYTTAHYGKWHLNGGGPGKHGFDAHDGETGNKGPGVYSDPNPKDIFGITKRANEFMEQSVKSGKPFYVQLSHYAVHSPTKANSKTVKIFEKTAKGTYHKAADYAAMTMDLDTSVGMVMDKIKALGISNNTYLIFYSDNGAGTRNNRKENFPLNGGKASLWEGGIRVPMMIAGPGIKGGMYSNTPVIGFDLFPTICELSKIKKGLSDKVEGTSLVTVLKNGGKLKRHYEELVFHFPHYGKGPKQKPQSAIIVGNKKLIKDYDSGELKLFDLDKDIGETNDLAKSNPEETEKLHQRLLAYLQMVKAQLPTVNSEYDPDAVSSQQRNGDGSRFFSRMDKDKDGKVSKSEFTGPARRFSRLDKNSDGFIASDEAPNGPPQER
ncbi:MAG: sulfatase [Victivallaceae bacterium]|nr:sulfatase [Victivallaceae bacterium]